jgi:hypothetical protein
MQLSTLLKWTTALLLTMALVGGLGTTPAVLAVVTTWHIAANGSDIAGDGTEANPFATIQYGIDTAANGDTVLVRPGVYRENINFNGKNITVGSLFVTTGNEDYLLQTVIDGQRNDHVVAFVNGETAAARLSGFTVINGYAHSASWPGNSGGGIICLNSSPTLSHLKIMSNESVQEGGGGYFAHCAATMRDVTITNNRAGSGGGIRYSYSSVSLDNAIVAHNLSRSGGAGIQFYHSEGAITNILISDNSGGAKGGGLHFDGCSPTFINATIVGNWTAGQGGGLNVSYMSQPTLVNSIVWGNSPEQIYFDTDWPGEAISIEYSDIQGGAAGIVTNGQGPVEWGHGNLDTSPRFADAGLGNYRLAYDSPALNAGKVAGASPTDIEGNPRPYPTGSNPDMGAYENPSGPTMSSLKVYLPILTTEANNDLLVSYDFEDNFLISGNVADRSGNGHDAQVNGTVSTATGISGGQAILFSGNGYLQASSNPAAGRTNVTFSLWFKTEHPENNYKLASGAWWNWGPGSGWIMATHIPELWSDDTQSLYLPGIFNNENHFPAGEWVHEVVTYDGDRIKEYTNGQLVNDWLTTGAAIGQGRPMVVGAWPPFSAYNFQGSIDEFRIYDRSLTQQEVQTLYNQGR